MYLAYYDEAGDDGFPRYSSPIFALSTIYLRYENWTDTFEGLRRFRRDLKDAYGLPVKTEFHTRQFLWNKNPYRQFGFSEDERIEMIDFYCDRIAILPVRIVNVVINKTVIRNQTYKVLDNALTYSIQRVENDLAQLGAENKFMIITDPGRVGKMSKTARRLRAINYIPSKIWTGTSYRSEIRALIEDPMPKDSRHSFLIQTADLVSFIVYLRKLDELRVGPYASRLPSALTPDKVQNWLDRLSPSLNLDASGRDSYGIVVYPTTP